MHHLLQLVSRRAAGRQRRFMHDIKPRYAIYYAPHPTSALWQIGSRFIGYDAVTGSPMPPFPEFAAVVDNWQQVMSEPARYGLHATLMAPFALAEAVSEAQLGERVAALAARLPACALGRLQPALMGSFLALVPEQPSTKLVELHTSIIETLQVVRAPLTIADRERRQPAKLSAVQRTYLDRWGYPYVLDQFRFHITLSGPADTDVLTALHRIASDRFGEHLAHVEVADVCIFRQSDRAARFEIMSRHALRP